MFPCSPPLLPDASSHNQRQWAGQDTSGAVAVLSTCLHRIDHTVPRDSDDVLGL